MRAAIARHAERADGLRVESAARHCERHSPLDVDAEQHVETKRDERAHGERRTVLIEKLTDLIQEAVLAEFERISERGGVLEQVVIDNLFCPKRLPIYTGL